MQGRCCGETSAAADLSPTCRAGTGRLALSGTLRPYRLAGAWQHALLTVQGSITRVLDLRQHGLRDRIVGCQIAHRRQYHWRCEPAWLWQQQHCIVTMHQQEVVQPLVVQPDSDMVTPEAPHEVRNTPVNVPLDAVYCQWASRCSSFSETRQHEHRQHLWQKDYITVTSNRITRGSYRHWTHLQCTWVLRVMKLWIRLLALFSRLWLDRSMALYIYKAKNCKLLVLFTQAQKTKFIFK